MQVLKFGGTSLSGPEQFRAVYSILKATKAEASIVVASAMGGITDLLLQLADQAARKDQGYHHILEKIEARHLNCVRELLPAAHQSRVLGQLKSELNVLETLAEGAYLIGEITPKLADRMMSYGELLSAYLLSEYLRFNGMEAEFKDSRDLIRTDEQFGKARVLREETYENCRAHFRKKPKALTVLPGFIGSTAEGNTTTLGRGGSDFTAALLAAALEAEELQIWTDVSGMYTANPRLVRQARAIPSISYEEAMELSHFGAKVLYPPTIQPVLLKGIPIRIKNTFAPEEEGTLVSRGEHGSKRTVRGISHVDEIALLTIEGTAMIGIPGSSGRIFGVLSQARISIVLITQASSEHSICLAVTTRDAPLAVTLLNEAFDHEIQHGRLLPVLAETGMAIVALVGDNMKNHQGLSGRMFSALGKNNVNIRAIAQGASERNISAVIREEDSKKALNTLHETFFEEQVKQLNLFIAGVGNVGSKFLAQLQQQKKYLRESLRLKVRVIAIANSRQMVFAEDGLSLAGWESELKAGEPMDPGGFTRRVKELNFRNSIFVDNTASEGVASTYGAYLSHSIAVVCCNKIACSSDFSSYRHLKELSRKYGAPFLFETNVGAGLPILDTLRHLITSGDKVRRIEAVLSGSLNFVWNNYKGEEPFYQVVQKAKEAGYTEPDPRIDLSGKDVMRKILILARESGYPLEMDAIHNESFLPPGSLEAEDNAAFFAILQAAEPEFRARYREASNQGCRLKYVAEFNGTQARVGLRHIPEGHDYFNLEGSDNCVTFFTERYPEQPLVIKGAGAGAEVTASGIFADIVRIGNF